MKVLIMTLQERVEHYYDLSSLPSDWQLIFSHYEKDVAKLLKLAGDAEAIFVDAIEPVPAALIEQMPRLKIIHSEGVGYEAIAVDAATRHGIYVCNNRGINSSAVAEQTILLLLACLRRLVIGDAMVRQGHQIEAKAAWSLEGLSELAGLQIGLVGMGAIAKETAKRLYAFDCQVHYYSRTPLTLAQEEAYHAHYLPLDDLLRRSDVVSLHIPAHKDTYHFMDAAAFAKMKPGAIFLNTARGDLVDQAALCNALSSGTLAAAGLDTITPEPVKMDNPLLQLPPDCASKITFSPHIAGITKQAFRRMHQTVWQNFLAVSRGEIPCNIVNEKGLAISNSLL